MEWVGAGLSHPQRGEQKPGVHLAQAPGNTGRGACGPGFAVLPDSGGEPEAAAGAEPQADGAGRRRHADDAALLDEADEAALLEQFARQAREGYGRAIADGLRALRSRPADRRELGKIGGSWRRPQAGTTSGPG